MLASLQYPFPSKQLESGKTPITPEYWIDNESEMATLCALRFPSPGAAAAALSTVRSLTQSGALRVTDAGIVVWKVGSTRPAARRVGDFPYTAAMNESFWSMLFSVIFFLRLDVTSLGEAAPAERCSLADLGISDEFVRSARERITAGASGLFLLTADANVDPVIAALEALDFTVMSTNLTNRQLDALRSAYQPQGDATSSGYVASESAWQRNRSIP